MLFIVYVISVREIHRTDVFRKWLKKLKDRTGRAIIYKRIERLADGNPGDSVPIGEGLSEMRIHYGPGYRVYYKTTMGCSDAGAEIIVLLCGGNKTSQDADIVKAKKLLHEPLEEGKNEDC
jgi:putative addiction module killer protein